MTRRIGIISGSAMGMAAAMAAAGLLSVGEPIASPRYAHRSKPLKVRHKPDRSKKQFMLKGVRP
ncbi:hypothetical protein IVA94_14595 [Bradyrhizobium sp. 156]|uniref:hypothetical protein n=1 Tax=Bradyrhizobium sp. 156 TaxID=2782630 RepID=UPI001FFBF47E|nr:hypothetical protein [Bradyrhizobium sp. 156]MCK1322097.1 hypothetical protein [Bradyrhizobium sp. 156]